MRVLVCGSRHFKDKDLLDRTLEEIHSRSPITELIHGAARGADRMAGEFAEVRGISVHSEPALWDTYGRAAGPIRNREMLKRGPDLVVGFLFEGSRGTKDMLDAADKAGVRTITILCA